MGALEQLRLIVVGVTIGAIGGSGLLGTSVDLRPVAVAVAAGAILFGLSFVLQRFGEPAWSPTRARVLIALVGRVIVTLAAALSVVLVLNVLAAPEARGVPARRSAQATVGPMPAAPSLVAGPTNRVHRVVPVAPIVPTSPHQVVRPPDAPQATTSGPRATVAPVSSPAAKSPVSPFATPRASPPSPPPIIPTLPPLPTLPIGVP